MPDLIDPRLSPSSDRRRVSPWAAVAVAAAIAAATALGALGTSRATAAPTATKTITAWFVKDDDVSKVLPQLNKEFEKAHPGVKIDLKLFAFSQMQTKARLALAGNNPPDIAQTGNQPALASELIAGGKLLNLQKYAVKYGWKQRFSKAWMDIQGTFNPKTGKPGKGDVYGLWQAIAPLVV